METRTEATIQDVYHAPDDSGTYELVDGRLVHMSPMGSDPNHVALAIAASLLAYERETGRAVPGPITSLHGEKGHRSPRGGRLTASTLPAPTW